MLLLSCLAALVDQQPQIFFRKLTGEFMTTQYKVIMGPAPYVSNWSLLGWLFGPSAKNGTDGYQSTIDQMANDGWELDHVIQNSMTVTFFYFFPRVYNFQMLVFKK